MALDQHQLRHDYTHEKDGIKTGKIDGAAAGEADKAH